MFFWSPSLMRNWLRIAFDSLGLSGWPLSLGGFRPGMFAHAVALRIVVVCILLQVLLGFVCITGSLAAFVCLGRCVTQLCLQAASIFWLPQLPSNAAVVLVDWLHACSFFN